MNATFTETNVTCIVCGDADVINANEEFPVCEACGDEAQDAIRAELNAEIDAFRAMDRERMEDELSRIADERDAALAAFDDAPPFA